MISSHFWSSIFSSFDFVLSVIKVYIASILFLLKSGTYVQEIRKCNISTSLLKTVVLNVLVGFRNIVKENKLLCVFDSTECDRDLD